MPGCLTTSIVYSFSSFTGQNRPEKILPTGTYLVPIPRKLIIQYSLPCFNSAGVAPSSISYSSRFSRYSIALETTKSSGCLPNCFAILLRNDCHVLLIFFSIFSRRWFPLLETIRSHISISCSSSCIYCCSSFLASSILFSF